MSEAAGTEIKLAYRASGNLLILSTSDDLDKEMVTKIYDVADPLIRLPCADAQGAFNVTQGLGQNTGGEGGGGGGGGPVAACSARARGSSSNSRAGKAALEPRAAPKRRSRNWSTSSGRPSNLTPGSRTAARQHHCLPTFDRRPEYHPRSPTPRRVRDRIGRRRP